MDKFASRLPVYCKCLFNYSTIAQSVVRLAVYITNSMLISWHHSPSSDEADEADEAARTTETGVRDERRRHARRVGAAAQPTHMAASCCRIMSPS